MRNKAYSILLFAGIFAILLLAILNIEAIASTPDIGYAILVAGSDEGNQFNVDTNRAYEALLSRGFDNTRIYWISSANCTLDALRSAFNWASVRVGPDSPLILYFSGHGAPDQFALDSYYVTPGTAKYPEFQWALDSAEGLGLLPPETPVIIIVDACFSGGFISTEDVWYDGQLWSDLGTVSSSNRIIITSTHHDGESPSMELYGSFFSHELWSSFEKGLNVRQAFIEASERANSLLNWVLLLGKRYKPWLDDNGDAVGHPPEALGEDGDFAATMTIGTSGEAPSVGEDAPNPALFNNCYTRNGGSTILGYPINKVHRWWDGYIQDFQGGEGYEGAIMQPDGVNDAFAVYGAIWAKYLSKGGAAGFLGYPLLDETEGPASSITGTRCRYNKFEGGAIVHRKETEPYESKTVFLGHGIFNKWEQLGYGASALGLPVCDENETPQSGAPGFYTTGVECSFEAGRIYWHRTGIYGNKAFEVHGAIADVYQNEGKPGGWLGFPVSDEYTNTLGYAQSDFEGGYITTTDGVNYEAFSYTTLATVETRPATCILQTGAILNGRIVDDGGSAIIERRFDWGTSPSCSDGWTADVSVSGDYFSYYLGSLNADTTYYFRAWAKNGTGWSHEDVLSFRTGIPASGTAPADFNADGIVNFKDFAILALAWGSRFGQTDWNPVCDISEPTDDVIDELDLAKLTQYWLFKRLPYGITTRVSVSSTGQQGNKGSFRPSISADGRYVAFDSVASNLVEGDTNGQVDIFVHDQQTGETRRVSVSSAGEQANGSSYLPTISADARYVAFLSDASNLVEGDTNGYRDVFVHDRQTGETTRVSVSSTGEQGNGTNYWDMPPSISAQGRYVAFESLASNLVEDDTNGYWDIFVHDRQTAVTSRVSLSSAGEQANRWSVRPSISADGRYVAFDSGATNLVEAPPNGYYDIFVHDRQTGVTVSPTNQQGDYDSYWPSISADGRYVAFQSAASNLVEGDTYGGYNIFAYDRVSSQTKAVSVSSTGEHANNDSVHPSISADGRYVAFQSNASNLVEGDTNGYRDVFVHDRQTGETTRVSVSSTGLQGNNQSHYYSSSISADGRYVAFTSLASNLVEGDTNGANDVFVHDRFGR
jgi:hypothetical protein